MGVVVRAVDVSKRFNLHHDKSIKERIVKLRRQSVEDFWALRNVDFELEASHTLGLIGANGSGKSTLLKLIAGILTPTTGYVERRGRVAALLELGAGFHPDLTGRENVYMNASILGLSRRQTDLYFDAIVDFSGIEQFLDNQVKYYSSGMYVRLAFSVAVHVEPEILLIDEVLAVGDEPFQAKCMRRIREFQKEGRTIILVTHGLETVRELCDRVIMLEKGELLIDGKPQEAMRAFRERHSAQVEGNDDEVFTGAVVLTHLDVTDGEGNTKSRFDAGDPLAIQLDIDAPESVHDPVIAITIYSHLDALVYGSDTAIRGFPLGDLRGRHRLRFDFGPIPMVEGQYFVSVEARSRDGKMRYHRLERHIAFKVFSSADEPGIIHLDPVIHLGAIPARRSG
ncbi:MAG: ABC transporter ATP-binding protein [Actinomycetota bacterium]|nr:ABC transporter ATP-binding protein [Actinomycetota bacterium]